MSAGEALVVVVGTGPIGLAYGHRLAEAGHQVVWGSDAAQTPTPPTTVTLVDRGSGERWQHRVRVRAFADIAHADLVVVALGASRWPEALPAAAALPGEPTIVTLGQSPLGVRAVPEELRPRTIVAFPGIAGDRVGDEVSYARLADLPTTVLRGPLPAQQDFTGSLSAEGFSCQGVDDDGWFAYRALQSIAYTAAILRAGGRADQLGRDRSLMRLLAASLREGVRALKASGVRGLLPADAVALHPLAAGYWTADKARQLRLDSGDLAYGVYARRMGAERAWLTAWALAVCDEAPTPTAALRELLSDA